MCKRYYISKRKDAMKLLILEKNITLSIFLTKMIRKDYILRQIGQILEALIRKFSDIRAGNDSYNPDEIQDLYLKYFNKDAAFFKALSTDEITGFFKENYDAGEVFARLQVLSELWYGEGQVTHNQQLQLKATALMQYIKDESGTFDWDLNRRLDEMKKNLSG